MEKFYIKQNDTGPNLRATLTDGTGAVVNIAGASVQFHMRDISGGTPKVDAAATIIDGANGVVEYRWQAGDTDTVGRYLGEFEVTYVDSTVETFPNDTNFLILIRDDLA